MNKAIESDEKRNLLCHTKNVSTVPNPGNFNRVYQAISATPFSQKVEAAIVAHRGIHNDPSEENSLTSLERAVKLGVAAEIDVFFTPSGESVLLHGPVLSWSANRLLHRGQLPAKLPLLQEALELANGRIPLMLDLKHLKLASQEALHRFTRSIQDYLVRYDAPLIIGAFDKDVISLKPHLPTVPIGLITFGLNSYPRRLGGYEFLVIQKDIYHWRKKAFNARQTKFLWTYSHLSEAVTATHATTNVGVCNISEQALTDWK